MRHWICLWIPGIPSGPSSGCRLEMGKPRRRPTSDRDSKVGIQSVDATDGIGCHYSGLAEGPQCDGRLGYDCRRIVSSNGGEFEKEPKFTKIGSGIFTLANYSQQYSPFFISVFATVLVKSADMESSNQLTTTCFYRAPIWTRKKATTESNTEHDRSHRWRLDIFSKENLRWLSWLYKCSKKWDPRRDV